MFFKTMRRIYFTTVLLLVSLTVSAQMTPEACIDKYPSLPSIVNLIKYDKDLRNPDEVKDDNLLMSDFLESVSSVKKQNSEMMAKTAKSEAVSQKNKILSEKISGSNLTAGQFKNMSEAEQKKAAEQIAMNKMKSLGLSQADIAKMKSGQMSEADQQALASKALKQMSGGMSMEDLKFMEKLTDEERATFMKQSGLAESMTAKMNADKKNNKLSSDLLKRYNLLYKEIGEVTEKWKNKLQLKGTRAYGDSLWTHKYAASYKQFQDEIDKLANMAGGKEWDKTHTKGQTAAEVKEIDAKLKAAKQHLFEVENKFYEEYIPVYHRALGGVLDFVRGTMMSTYRRWKSVNDEAYKQTGESKYMIGDYQIATPASAYAETLDEIKNYSLDVKGKVFSAAD